MKRFWLAREGQVYGPYELPQLRVMNNDLELMDEDQLCQDGTENWTAYPDWRDRHCRISATTKVPVRVPGKDTHKTEGRAHPKASDGPKHHPKDVEVPDVKHRTKHGAAAGTAAATESEARHKPGETRNHDSTVNRCMHAINGGGSHERGYGHPLKYVRKDVVEAVVEWLDRHHSGWENDAWKPDADPSHALDRWLIPAIAKLHPETIKETYKCEFGPRKHWRVL